MFLMVVKHENSKNIGRRLARAGAENYEMITLRSTQKFHQV